MQSPFTKVPHSTASFGRMPSERKESFWNIVFDVTPSKAIGFFTFFGALSPLCISVLIKQSTNLFIFHQRNEKFSQRIDAILIQTASLSYHGCKSFQRITTLLIFSLQVGNVFDQRRVTSLLNITNSYTERIN